MGFGARLKNHIGFCSIFFLILIFSSAAYFLQEVDAQQPCGPAGKISHHFTLKYQDRLEIQAGTTCIFESTATILGDIENNGKIVIQDEFHITEDGSLENFGEIQIDSDGKIVNDGKITNEGLVDIDGILVNFNTFENEHEVHNWETGTIFNQIVPDISAKPHFTNFNLISNLGKIHNFEVLINRGEIANNRGGQLHNVKEGTIENFDRILIDDDRSYIQNYGTLKNHHEIIILGRLTNYGEIINHDTFYIEANSDSRGNIDNIENGIIENHHQIRVNGGFFNSNVLTNYHNIAVYDTMINTGTINNLDGPSNLENGILVNGTSFSNGSENSKNNGIINNGAFIYIKNGLFENRKDSIITNHNMIHNSASFDNSGRIENAVLGNIVNSNGRFENNGEINNFGMLNNTSTSTPDLWDFANRGEITIVGGEILNRQKSIFHNYETIYNKENPENEFPGSITNEAEFTNFSIIFNAEGTIENFGEFKNLHSILNEETITIHDGIFTNNGAIHTYSSLEFAAYLQILGGIFVNEGTVLNSGITRNLSFFENNGSFANLGSGDAHEDFGVFTNRYVFHNNGLFTNAQHAAFEIRSNSADNQGIMTFCNALLENYDLVPHGTQLPNYVETEVQSDGIFVLYPDITGNKPLYPCATEEIFEQISRYWAGIGLPPVGNLRAQ